MRIDKKQWRTERRGRNWRGGCDRRTRAWRWSIHTPRESMWAIVRITWRCDQTAIRNQCGDSSASQQICIG